MFFNYPVEFIKIKYEYEHELVFGWDREYGGPNLQIFAPFTGIVISTLESSDKEKRVVIKYEDEVHAYYAKYVHFSNVFVTKNDEVNNESIIGQMGKNEKSGTNECYFTLYKCPLDVDFNFSIEFHNEYVVDAKEYLYVHEHQTVYPSTANLFTGIRYLLKLSNITINLSDEVHVKNFPSVDAGVIDILTSDNKIINIYGECDDYYLISNTKSRWIKKSGIEKFISLNEKNKQESIIRKIIRKFFEK